jgi:autotransporter translocation and assembly factor TamB
MLRWVVRIGLAAVALVALGWGALRLYVGSDAGRRVVERKADEKVAPIGGHIVIGKISGTLVGGVTLDEVAWQGEDGRPFFRAQKVTIKGSAVSALAHHPSVSIRVEAPELDLDRMRAGVDLDEAARLLDAERDHVESVALERLEIVGGTITIGGKTLTGVELVAAARLDKTQRLGDRGSLRIEKLTAHGVVAGAAVPIAASGAVEWDGPRFQASQLSLHLGSSLAVVDGSLGDDAVDLGLTRLRIAPEDLRHLSPTADAPKHAITGEARLHGPLDRIALTGSVRPDAGTARLDGSIDARARRGSVRLTLEGVEAEYTPAVLDGKIDVRGAIDRDDVFTATWSADGSYGRRRIDPNLQSRVAAVTPGGKLHGEGRITFDPAKDHAVRMHYRVALDDPGQAARLVAGRDRDLPETKPFVLEGSWPER